MPYVVVRDESACSANRPWAVKKKGTDKVFGCHATKKEAEDQQSALYANEANALAFAAAQEREHLSMAATRPLGVLAATGFDIALTTRKNVEIFEVGMQFPASTGPWTVGFEHVAAVAQEAEDPTLPRPRIKLGHSDPRLNNQYVFDAEPNFGFVANMRASEDGAKCIGDFEDIPVWLDAIMPVAYPSRSVEGWENFRAVSGKEYPFVMTNLALLGVVWPGILTIADLPSLANMYGSAKPGNVTILSDAA